jgi:hypothetical protein
MTTTNELHSIVEELELVDIGDAASYLGEEVAGSEEISGEHASLSFPSLYDDTGMTPLESQGAKYPWNSTSLQQAVWCM